MSSRPYPSGCERSGWDEQGEGTREMRGAAGPEEIERFVG